jgi:hypothetical protein
MVGCTTCKIGMVCTVTYSTSMYVLRLIAISCHNLLITSPKLRVVTTFGCGQQDGRKCRKYGQVMTVAVMQGARRCNFDAILMQV